MITRKRYIPKNMEKTTTQYLIQKFLFEMSGQLVDLNPDFQREFVWTKQMQEALIYSIYCGNPIGTVTLWRNDGVKKATDGKQRLTTLLNFYNNKLVLSKETALKVISVFEPYLKEIAESDDVENNKAKKLLKKQMQKNPKIKFEELTSEMQEYFLNFDIPIIDIFNANEEQVRDYFRRIQHQEKLKAGEIINAINSKVLNNFISNINDLQKLKLNLGFKKDRNDFQKIYYNIVGILEGKLTLGVTDDKIIRYAEDIDWRKKEIDSNIELQKKLNNLNVNLNKICNAEMEFTFQRSDLKFLLLICANNFWGLNSKKSIEEIMNGFEMVTLRFKAFYSAKREEAIKNYFPNLDMDDDLDLALIQKYEEISALRKGNHSIDNTEARMKGLIKLLEYEIDNPEKIGK